MNPVVFHPFTAHEITSAIQDTALLRQFYNTIYVPEFPDSNERESLDNMERYLQLKEEGWYQKNNYHILLYLDQGTPIGGSIIDYLSEPNVGVIEFLVVASSFREKGLGKKLLQWTEDTLDKDSRCAGYEGWTYIIGEMNDPFKTYELTDSMDQFKRAMVWDRWGYRKARFPYVQPSLSPEKKPVSKMLLLCKPGRASDKGIIPSSTLKEAIYGYARWAMRIENPNANHECLEMSGYLQKRTAVDLIPLATYIGDESSRHLTYADLTVVGMDELDAVLDIYAASFSAGPTSVPKELFKQALMSGMHEGQPFAYHLLSLKTKSDGLPEGMASFFTFPGAGFGGYVVFDPEIRGKGHLSEVITVIERTMAMDKKGAQGWCAECDPADNSAPIFKKRGFHEIDIIYRQPPLSGQPPYSINKAPVLHLIYKEFGERFEVPRLEANNFLDALGWIFRVIYRMEEPEQSEYYQNIKKQLGLSEYVRWKGNTDKRPF